MKYFFALWVFISFSIPAFFANSQSLPSYVPTNGLIGWWGFNGNANDLSGNGNNPISVNYIANSLNRFNQPNSALTFNANSKINYNILHDSLSNLIVGQIPITISFWAKTSNNNVNSIFVLNGDTNITNGSTGLNLTINSNQNCGLIKGFSFWNGSYMATADFQNTIDSNWHCYTIVMGSNNDFSYSNIKFFVDGILKNLSCSHNWVGATYWMSQMGFSFGAETFQSLIGQLDDIGIWNRALTQQEITNLYNSQPPNQTSLCLPTISTNTPTSIGIDSVIVGGNITNDGGSSIVLRGVCYSTTPNPNMGNMRTEDGAGVGSFSTILRNLSPSTTYYVRSYAKNSNGVVVYGDEVSFSTSTPVPSFLCGTSTVTDVDGNNYNTVQIGNQCWTQSNLKVSKYRNGDSIPTGLSNVAWQSTTSGAYSIYANNPVNDGLYGKLYNHYAVTDSRGLCPTGWHVPSDAEWNTLETFWVSSSVAGGALKSTSILPTPGGWYSPNTGATNSSGFTARPGGRRNNSNGAFIHFNTTGYCWSTSPSGTIAWSRYLIHSDGTIYRSDYNRANGLSVRCLKD